MPRLISPELCVRLRRLTEVHGLPTAAEILGMNIDTARAIRRRGWRAATERRKPRPVPPDFAIQCDTLKIKELCQLYRAGDWTVRRWAREVGRRYKRPAVREPITMPDGGGAAIARYGDLGMPSALAAIVADRGALAAAEMYGVSYGTLRTWRHRLGLPVSWSRQPGARRGRIFAAPSQAGWADRYFEERKIG